MTKYCETCKKPFPQGHTTCPTCAESVALDAKDVAGQANEDALPESLRLSSSEFELPSAASLLSNFPELGRSEAETVPAQATPRASKGADRTAEPGLDSDDLLEVHDLQEEPKTQKTAGDAAIEIEAEDEALAAEVVDDAADEPLAAELVEEPEEETLAAEVVEEPEEEPVAAELVDETGDETLAAELVEEPGEETLAAEVVDEAGDETIAAELVDESEEEPLAAELVSDAEEEPLAAEIVDEPEEGELVADVVDEPPTEEPLEAELTDSSAEVEALMQEISGPSSEPSSAPQAKAESKKSKPAKAAKPEGGPPSDVPAESALDQTFALPFPAEESTSSVDLGSSSVIEIPSGILNAAEQEKQSAKGKKKKSKKHSDGADDSEEPPATELVQDDDVTQETTHLGLAPVDDEDDVMDLGEVAARRTKLGKRATPTQLIQDEDLGETEQLESLGKEPAGEETELAASLDDEQLAEGQEPPIEGELSEEEALAALSSNDEEQPLTPSLADAAADEWMEGEANEGELAEEPAAVATLESEEESPARGRTTAKPIKPTHPRYLRRWFGGMALGLLLGLLGYFALWAYDVRPLDKVAALGKIRALTGAGSASASAPIPKPTPVAKPKVNPHELLADGNFVKAVEAFKETKIESPSDLTEKGEAIWLAYLQKQNKALDPNAKEVQEAVKLFTDARNLKSSSAEDTAAQAQALFWLARIDEQFGKVDEARKMYTEGAAAYPQQQQIFQTQLNRLADVAAGVGANLPRDPAALRAVVVMLLVGFQPAEQAPKAEAAEAAPDFFEALVLVRKGEFDKAIDRLKSARKIHDEQRFNRLRKAQNPKTDPLEESFLKACDELIAFVEVQKSLKQHGYLDVAGRIDVKKLDGTLGEAELAGKTLQVAAKKLKDAKLDDADVPKAVDGLIKEHDTLQSVTDKAKDATKIDDVTKAVEALVKDRDTLDAAAKAIKDAKIDEPQVPKAVALLLKDRSTLQAAVDKLKDAKIDAADVPKGVAMLLDIRKTLDAVSASLEKAGVKEKDPLKAVADIVGQRDGASARLAAITKKLVAMKAVPANAKPQDIDAGLNKLDLALAKADPAGKLREMLTVSEEKVRDRDDKLAKLEERRQTQLKEADAKRVAEVTKLEDARKRQVKSLEDVLAQRHTPQEMVDYWATFLKDRASAPEVNQSALLDVTRVRTDKQSKTADRGRALLVEGLADRNLGKYDDARKKLEEAKDFDGASKEVTDAAGSSLAELTDPAIHYFPEAHRAISHGHFDRASTILAEAEKVFPEQKGKLAIEHGTLLFEKARFEAGDTRLTADNPALEQVLAAAKEAGEAGNKAEALYLLGRVDEELAGADRDKLVVAREKFDQALQLLAKDSPNQSLYQVALARVLWKIHRATPSPVGPRLGLRLDAPASPRREVLALLLTGLIGGDDTEKLPPGQTKEGKQADDIAKRLEKQIADKDFLSKSQLLGIQGHWDEALQTYLKGLEGQMPRDQIDVLRLIIENHPGLRQPPPALTPDAKLADQYWAAGLSHFWSRRYADAETSFYSAAKYDSQDARYRYFLGMSQWLQNLPAKRDDAIHNFNEGSKLEKAGRPASDAVNAALERVQGSLRLTLNEYRP